MDQRSMEKSSSKTSVSLSVQVMGPCQSILLDSVHAAHKAEGQHENTESQIHEVTGGEEWGLEVKFSAIWFSVLCRESTVCGFVASQQDSLQAE